MAVFVSVGLARDILYQYWTEAHRMATVWRLMRVLAGPEALIGSLPTRLQT